MFQKYEKSSIYDTNFSLQKKISHPLHEEIQILQNDKTFERVLCQQKNYNDSIQFKQILQHIQKLVHLKHEFILQVLDYSCTLQKKLCSSSYLVKIFYQCPETDLKKEMDKRKQNGQKFSSVLLTYIFYQQLQANQYLEQKGIYHGSINPYNISLNRGTQKSQLIMINNNNITGQQQYIENQKKYLIQNLDLYQSPEVFELMFQKKQQYEIEINDEETYSLGLIILECGLNKSIQDIYKKKQKKFDHQKLSQYYQEFSDIYYKENPLLVTAVEHMINLDENPEKSNFTEILESCPSYNNVHIYLQNILNPNQVQESQFQFQVNNFQVKAQNTQYQHEFKESQQKINNTNQGYNSYVKHEYIKGNQTIEPQVIREDRTSYIPYPTQ